MHRGGGGFSFLEVLISTTLFTLVFAGVFLLYVTMQGTMTKGELSSDLQQNARVGLDRMVQEIRNAGYDPEGSIPKLTINPKGAIRAARPSCFSFITYAPDRSTNPPTPKSKQITYNLSGTTMSRREDPWVPTVPAPVPPTGSYSGGSAQALAEHVNALTFTYYTANNEILVPQSWTSTLTCPPSSTLVVVSATQLDYWQMRQIRRVVITIQTQDVRPRVSSEFFTISADVYLRNL